MADSPSDVPPRAGIFAGTSLLLGLFFIYAFPDLQVGYPALNNLAGAVCLLLSSYLTFRILTRNYSYFSVTYWGLGLVLVLSVLPLYFAIKSADYTCHVTTAKWVTLLMGFAGFCLLIYGLVHRVERGRQVAVDGPPDSSAWTPSEIKNLVLLLMLLLALYALWQRFIVNCWW
jgi:hypothetical protein